MTHHPYLIGTAIFLLICFAIVMRIAYLEALDLGKPKYRPKKKGKVVRMDDPTDITKVWDKVKGKAKGMLVVSLLLLLGSCTSHDYCYGTRNIVHAGAGFHQDAPKPRFK